jgi:dephospho-CoA kinase
MYLGLTGNIASGKSAAAKIFEELGCYTIDADSISRIVMQPGGAAYDGVVELFGSDVVTSDSSLDRGKIRKLVFDNPEMRKKLEAVVHPAIAEYERREVGRIKGSDDKAIIITQAAVTIEAGTYKRFDRMIVVYTDPETQLARVMQRDGISEEDAKKIIAAQMPIEEKLKYADYVIDNSGDMDSLRKEVERVCDLIKLTKYGKKHA